MAEKKETVQDTLPVDAPVKVRERRVRSTRKDFADAVNPDLHVKLVRDTDKRIAYHKQMGYEVAKPAQIAAHDGYERDGRVQFGDRVAMVCAKEDLDERNDERMIDYANAVRGGDAANEAGALDGHSGQGFKTYSDHGQAKTGKSFNIPIDLPKQ
jgi:rhodanese-related sulfurtransferase